MQPPLTGTMWLLAALPIVSVLGVMIGLRWSGGRAGLLGFLLVVIIGSTAFRAGPDVLAVGVGKGLWSIFFILLIIWGALALYHLVDGVGGFDRAVAVFQRLSGRNTVLPFLLVAWVFPSFLQGIFGFGTPVAIATPLLMAMGLGPFQAVAAALVGHSWSVTFGSLGSSYAVLVGMTGLDPQGLAIWSAGYLAALCGICGLSVVVICCGRHRFVQALPSVLVLAAVMAGALMVTAAFGSPYLASMVAGLAGLLVGLFVLTRLGWGADPAAGAGQAPHTGTAAAAADPRGLHRTFMPYYLLVLIVIGVHLTPLGQLLGRFQWGPSFPATTTQWGWTNPGAAAFAPLDLLTTPGTLIFVSFVCGYLWFRRQSAYDAGSWRTILARVPAQARGATATLMAMGMMAVSMEQAGMVAVLADGMAAFMGGTYAMAAPLVGVLGAMMTGSNTSSNILFAVLQRDVALRVGLEPLAVLAAQTSGGSIGALIDPTKAALGTAVAAVGGQEGEVFRITAPYLLVMVLVLGLLTVWLG